LTINMEKGLFVSLFENKTYQGNKAANSKSAKPANSKSANSKQANAKSESVKQVLKNNPKAQEKKRPKPDTTETRPHKKRRISKSTESGKAQPLSSDDEDKDAEVLSFLHDDGLESNENKQLTSEIRSLLSGGIGESDDSELEDSEENSKKSHKSTKKKPEKTKKN